MSSFRSETLGLYNLLIPFENAWEIMSELGTLSCLEFIDMNQSEIINTRPYYKFIKACNHLEAKLDIIEIEMKKWNKTIKFCHDVDAFFCSLEKFLKMRNKDERTYFHELEIEIDDSLADINRLTKILGQKIENYYQLQEYKFVLSMCESLLKEKKKLKVKNSKIGKLVRDISSSQLDLESHLFENDISFSHICGTISSSDAQIFTRMIFRATRGLFWIEFFNIDDSSRIINNNPKFKRIINLNKEIQNPKSAFFILYKGGRNQIMKKKLDKISTSLQIKLYDIPEEYNLIESDLAKIDKEIIESLNLANLAYDQLNQLLESFSKPRLSGEDFSMVEEYRMFVLKEKLVYHNLNCTNHIGYLLRGMCWCPQNDEQRVILALRTLCQKQIPNIICRFIQVQNPTKLIYPTFIKSNEFTKAFQDIVNTYGIPRYKEINPAVFTIATFPFLFGVMFGDIGHGLIIIILAYKPNVSGMLSMPAIPYYEYMLEDLISKEEYMLKTPDCVYPIGIDPSWLKAQNELAFVNSFRMKLSLIIGIVQMLFGIILKGFNAIYFKKRLDFFFEFIPQLIFFTSILGYMAFLIIFKWMIHWDQPNGPSSSNAPNLINTMVNMFIRFGEVEQPLYSDTQGLFQQKIQKYIIIIGLICIFLMLIPKPLILLLRKIKRSNLKINQGEGYLNQIDEQEEVKNEISETKQIEMINIQSNQIKPDLIDENELRLFNFTFITDKNLENEGHDESNLSHIIMEQLIMTIEFVLGTISNTASYLRLWALSLAHSQLSTVFIENTLISAINSGNPFRIVLGFLTFCATTFGILICMDTMECFLHTLRLHWVEFQNKFYHGDGKLFIPYSFHDVLNSRHIKS